MSDADAAWIDSWRHSVPSRLEREDPFENDGFEARCSTRLTFREPDIPPKSATRVFLRSITPFRRLPVHEAATGDGPSAGHGVLDDDSPQRCNTMTCTRRDNRGRRGWLGLFSRKRKQRSPSPVRGLAMDVSLRLRVLCVGDRGCGQTALLYRAKFGTFLDTGVVSRSPYETYMIDRQCDLPTTMELWDTSGTGDMETVSRLSYMSWGAVLLCFDVKEKTGMLRVLHWWQEAVRKGFCRDAHHVVYLVGTKKDLRMECLFEDHRLAAEEVGLGLGASCCVSRREADWHARRIGADGYVECSAVTGEGVEALFGAVGRAAARRLGGEDDGGRVTRQGLG